MAKASFSGSPVNIKVVGLGGCGCNAITRMVSDGIRGVEFVAMNTDRQALALTEAPVRIQLGMITTHGTGAGGNPEIGHEAAEESRDEINAAISGADMVFITCGMGGGTGTGSSAIVADIARKAGALTVGIVTKPFSFEGRHRMEVAEKGIASLLNRVDSLVVIANDRLASHENRAIGLDDAFRLSDNMLKTGIQVIAEVLNTPGIINLDFADIRAILRNSGSAFISSGTGRGPDRAVDAAQSALFSPLLDKPVHGAKGILFNILGSDNLTLREVNQAAEFIKQVAEPEANIIFGVANDPSLAPNTIKITLIATGFHDEADAPKKDGVPGLTTEPQRVAAPELKPDGSPPTLPQ